MNRININKLSYKVFIFTSFLFIFSTITAQDSEKKITIQDKSISLRDVLAQIEKQTGYSIAYEQSNLDLKKKISVSLKKVNIHKALSEILKSTGFTYKITGYHVILIPECKEIEKQKNTENKAQKIRQTLTGIVIDERTKKPIEYATVSLVKEPAKGTITDSLGHFEIAGIPVGPHDVKVSILGHKSIIFYDVINIPGRGVVFDISLDKNNHYLNEVVVTGRSAPEDLVQSTQMGALSLSKMAIKNVPVIFGEADVVKALQTQPGVVGGIEGLAGMYVRGGNGDENLYMLDGNPLYQINHFGGLFSAFNTEIIKNVDFYKSAFPARYGGRLSSIVNVQTKDGDMKEFHGTAMLGLTSGGLHIEGPIVKEKTSFSASIRRSWLEAVSVPALEIINSSNSNEGNKTLARYAFTDVNLKVKHLFNNRSHAYVNFYWGQDYLKFGKEEYDLGDDPFRSGDVGRLRWGNLLLSPGWSYVFSEKLSSNISASYIHYASNLKRSVYETFGNETDKNKNSYIENSTENGIDNYSFKADFNYLCTSSHHIRFGANFTHHRFRPEFTRSYSNTDNGQSISGNSKETLAANEMNIYIEDDWKLSSFLSLNAGLRLGYFKIRDESYWSLEPRLSTRFLLSQDLSLKASYSRMDQNIQQVSESYISLPTDYWVPVIENQKPLVSDQVSLGTYYNLNNNYSFSLEGYYKWMNNLLDYKEGYNFLPSTVSWQNKLASGKGWSYGTDFIIRKETGRITGYVGYGLMLADRKFDEINGGKKYPSKYDNRHKINIVANWKVSDNVELNAGWTYMTGNRVTISLENYQSLDVAGFPPGLAPADPYLSQDFPGINYYDKKNNVRMPSYHRLDVSINIYRPKKNGRMGIWNISVYNVYSRMNPIAITKESMYSSSHSFPTREIQWRNNFKTLSLFPIIPSISYTYKF